jgi:hypothetical protein
MLGVPIFLHPLARIQTLAHLQEMIAEISLQMMRRRQNPPVLQSHLHASNPAINPIFRIQIQNYCLFFGL